MVSGFNFLLNQFCKKDIQIVYIIIIIIIMIIIIIYIYTKIPWYPLKIQWNSPKLHSKS